MAFAMCRRQLVLPKLGSVVGAQQGLCEMKSHHFSWETPQSCIAVTLSAASRHGKVAAVWLLCLLGRCVACLALWKYQSYFLQVQVNFNIVFRNFME